MFFNLFPNIVLLTKSFFYSYDNNVDNKYEYSGLHCEFSMSLFWNIRHEQAIALTSLHCTQTHTHTRSWTAQLAAETTTDDDTHPLALRAAKYFVTTANANQEEAKKHQRATRFLPTELGLGRECDVCSAVALNVSRERRGVIFEDVYLHVCLCYMWCWQIAVYCAVWYQIGVHANHMSTKHTQCSIVKKTRICQNQKWI